MDGRQRRALLAEINATYVRLKARPGMWAEELDERSAWDTTVGDGIEQLSRPRGRGKAGAAGFWPDDN